MSTPEPGRASVAIEQVCMSFGHRVALQGVSLQAAAGEVLAVTGPNGSGKSTLLRILAGLLRPVGGHGEVLGSPLGAYTRPTRNAIGYLPQRAALYPRLSAFENIRLRAALGGLAEPAAAARQALRQAGVHGREHDRLGVFSGGWIRRIEIAATMVHQPRLLVLDEPATGLDATSEVEIWRRITGFSNSGGIVVFSSHDRAQLARAHRTVWLDAARAGSPGA